MRFSMVVDFGTIGVALLAFHVIVSVPASGWYSVTHSFDVAVTLPLILPDRIDTDPGPVTAQPARKVFTFIVVGAVPPTRRGGLLDAVPIIVWQVIEWLVTSIFSAHPIIGASDTRMGSAATFIRPSL